MQGLAKQRNATHQLQRNTVTFSIKSLLQNLGCKIIKAKHNFSMNQMNHRMSISLEHHSVKPPPPPHILASARMKRSAEHTNDNSKPTLGRFPTYASNLRHQRFSEMRNKEHKSSHRYPSMVKMHPDFAVFPIENYFYW